MIDEGESIHQGRTSGGGLGGSSLSCGHSWRVVVDAERVSRKRAIDDSVDSGGWVDCEVPWKRAVASSVFRKR
jgi:hypothetical protein